MTEIPINRLQPHEQDLKLLPLGNITPYDFYKPHRHDYFEIFFFTKGGGKHFIDFIEYQIADNSVHIVFPQQIHLVNRSKGADGFVMLISRSYLNFLGKIYYPKLLDYYSCPSILPSQELFEDILHSIKKLHGALSEQNEMGEALAQNHTAIMVAELIKAQSLLNTEKKSKLSYTEYDWMIYKTFIQLLEDNFLEKKTVGTYAAELNVSEKVLNKCVCRVNNKSCAALIQERTLIEAKRLLIFSGESIKEVAYALNFQDSSYFTRFFSRLEQMSPKEFRTHWEEKYHS